MTKQELIAKLYAFAAQRPGMEPANYGDYSSYRSESRSVTRDLHHARQLLRAVEWRESITVHAILEALRHSYSGRLSLNEETGEVSYCTGQYFPAEFRRAVCAVAASCIWDYTRENNPQLDGNGLRKMLRAEFGATIQRCWFN